MDIYELSNFGIQEAFWWWLLFPLGGIIAAFWPSEKHGLAILGMAGAGKTTFYNHLRKECVNGQTSVRELDEFSVDLGNGKKITIKKGKDVGGTEKYIQPLYELMIEEAYYILFFFNAYEYLNDRQYARETNARIDFINGKMTDKKIFRVVITYADKFSDRDKAITDIMNGIGDDQYNKFFFDPRNYSFINLINKTERNDLVNKLFVKK